MTINCLILDDEPIARDVIRTHMARIPELRLVRSCSNATEAYEALAAEPVDLLFLDVQMPGIMGTDFLRTLAQPPLVIFTTAYAMYAVEGFALNSVDYLLKPITFERFYEAFQRVRERMLLHQGSPASLDYLFIKQDYKLVRVNYGDMAYIQAEGDFCAVHIGDKRLLVGQALKAFESQLPQRLFMRVHRSYIVNLAHIQAIKGNVLDMGHAAIPIGPNYRDALLKRLRVF